MASSYGKPSSAWRPKLSTWWNPKIFGKTLLSKEDSRHNFFQDPKQTKKSRKLRFEFCLFLYHFIAIILVIERFDLIVFPNSRSKWSERVNIKLYRLDSGKSKIWLIRARKILYFVKSNTAIRPSGVLVAKFSHQICQEVGW